ncbi:DNA-directed RNA polymerase subunit alpha C-terminal domain-containing protein [Clostridium sp. C105KSO13]|uniref:DNA-directed RNA polymerase subunit alpha C-terminal domain-containing protein n=1 Tax=Clostridium sp. C105KSO13 TaxID=1776045 RepID=UPI0007405CE7|nr:DNA-directed RNA polymerase subunit alpha C-terminal domain-containing protein [Clostridium sp. C105KSO13]CUX27975.1 DNA-directed RNA polymerase subunit alpha [Clostridium sp. C105KSO13]
MKIDELELNVRPHNVLLRAGVNSVEVLDTMSDDELLKIHNFNHKCLADVREKLKNFKKSKHWECKYCDYTRPVEYPDDPGFYVCGRCGAEWLDCKVLVSNEI